MPSNKQWGFSHKCEFDYAATTTIIGFLLKQRNTHVKKWLKRFIFLLIILAVCGGGGYYYYEHYYKQEDPGLAYRKAMMYEQGVGVEKDVKKSLYWLKRAAALGNTRAQMQLAWYYHEGTLVAKNPEAAANWYEKAAKAGVPEAQYMMGYIYQNALGRPKNDETAMAWFERAAENGNQNAQLLLGVIYSDRNEDKFAYAWLNLAATSRNDQIRAKALVLRDTLAEEMKPADITAAQKLSDELYKTIQIKKKKVTHEQ